MDAGICAIYELKNIASTGAMPKLELVEICKAYYAEQTLGVTRAYAALGAKQRIDALIRCFNIEIPYAAEYVILEDGLQYRISLKQKSGDNVDLTLERLEKMLDVFE